MLSKLIPQTKLGNSGLKISRIICGTMTFGLKLWAPFCVEDEELVFSILKKCYDSGIRTFDTADMYSNGQSEILLGKFLRHYLIPRDKVVIMSKLFFPVPETPSAEGFDSTNWDQLEWSNSRGLSRKHILQAAEKSVERLGTYMDLYQIHKYDPEVPAEEIMRGLNDVVERGWTRYIGALTMKAVQFAHLQHTADKNGWHKFIAMQNYYNLLYREEEREMLPLCEDILNVGVIPWSPNARGLLTRPLLSEASQEQISQAGNLDFLVLDNPLGADSIEIINRVEKLAKEKGVSMAQISNAWVLHKGYSPIIGINSLARVDDTLKSLDVVFTEEEVKYLEEPYKPKRAQV
ncbi:hypothetical protein BABINDRAFT_9804 [Babjeviella inositovora NRRL Y-12698]|uniref:NADP-dependent oxidoreductase domain-containing protein n=1 Tax=Babjeviella inositovora NRRL Y-12698 TaxID=984486 RepID=A0A1E3QJM1_9ASCO|nr:uncharacterized protein BABINDRAFT_9804 [Babjeviella inositovora NRRL Y-12698]ODQ77818.1 hypothetical protein BABINDRAFT_9804 [Babjeviella inositovora NRRL Y-12698]